MRPTRLLALVLAIITVVPLGAATAQTTIVQPYGTNDGGVNVFNILPPGQGRYMNSAELLQAQSEGSQPPHNTDQLEMYSALVQGTPGVSMANLSTYFKDATFGVKEDDIEREYSPREGVTVLRDAGFGVPHVYGATRSDVMFGAGYVSAEDRLFMMDTLRHVGRGRVSEFLGASEANLALDRAAYATTGYTEEELQAQIDRLPKLDPVRGPQVLQDVTDYVAGINAFIGEANADPTKLPGEYPALQQTPTEWLPTDTVAIAALIGSQLGVGGGRELGNAAFFNALLAEGNTPRKARSIFNDLRFANDPEAPVTTPKRFEYNLDLGRVKRASVAIPDPAPVPEEPEEMAAPGVVDGPFGPIRLAFPDAMSNAVLVDGKHSKSGRPIAVFGPQTGYWSPQILMELDLHGPGIDARGVGFPGISLYVLLGRGQDYAWSATSAGGDLVDTFAEKLCNPDGGEVAADSTFYMKGGECVEMYTRTDSWTAKPSAGGAPESPSQESVQVEMTIQRTEDGIVQARGTVGGKPVAFVTKRSSYGGEVDSALAYVDLMDADKINDAGDFRKAFQRFNFTFNWFYIDEKQIAYQLGGRHPLRAKGTDPDFPVWGTGKWKWRGMLPNRLDPWEAAPKRGWIVSWNNKQAPGFTSADSSWAYGPVYRSQLLSDPVIKGLKRGRKLSLTDLVDIMGVAATQDLRGYRILRYMLAAVGKPVDDRMAAAKALLKQWKAAGAPREAAEPDGTYTHAAAVALMDAWWEKAIEAIFRPTLGTAFDVIPQGFDNEPGFEGSAYQGGFYGQVQKDLRTVLGKKVRGRWSRIYCGKGRLAACREAMRASLDAAIAELEAAFGADPAAWDPTEEDDRIEFVPLGIQTQDTMQWQNRPTFQQVVEFRGL